MGDGKRWAAWTERRMDWPADWWTREEGGGRREEGGGRSEERGARRDGGGAREAGKIRWIYVQ